MNQQNTAKCEPVEKLNRLLTSQTFSRQNKEKIARVCHDMARLVYERQKRTGKTDLGAKDISAAVILAETLHSGPYRFVAEGPLAAFFGQACDEAKALDYFGKHVMGTVKDVHGRELLIDEHGMKSLYKDPVSGGHIDTPENYEESRGKRLPWIRHTLCNSPAIYYEDEWLSKTEKRRKWLYTAIATIRHSKGEETAYYMVLMRERKSSPVPRMITAFYMDERNSFLHQIAVCRRYIHESKVVI